MNKIQLAKSTAIKNVCCVLTLGLALTAGVGYADNQSNDHGSKPEHPTQAHLYGKSLTEWMMLYSAWFAQGQDPNKGTIGKVQLLPMPQQEATAIPPTPDIDQFLKGSLDVTLQYGSPFMVSVIALTGELFVDDIIPPDEALPVYKQSLIGADVLVTLDGKPILRSPQGNLNAFIGPAYFPQPVLYSSPQFRYTDNTLGDIYASGIVWVEGIGFVQPPLSAGQHTLHVYALNPVLRLGFDNTWNITVKSKEHKSKEHK
jgi:hypothetical protein